MALLTRDGRPEPARVPLDGVLSPREFARIGALLLGSAALIGVVGLGLLAVSGRAAGGPDFHPGVVASMCAVTIGGCGVLIWRAERFVPTAAAFVMAFAILLLSAVAYFSGSRAEPFVTVFYIWAGIGFVLLPTRIAMLEVALAGVLDAVLLAVQEGHIAPFGSWEFTFGVTALTAWVIKRLVDAVMATAGNERAARSEAQRGNDELERISLRETAFLTQISHEVRTPLNVIIGFADMLGEGLVGPLNEQQTEYVAEVQGSGHHLLELIGDVLDVAKVEEGREDLEVVEFDLDRVLVPAVSLFRPEAERRGIRLDLAAAGTPIVLRGDERKVRQVVLNLLSNAVKFTPSGGSVTVSSSVRGGAVSISVADTGPGIAAADLGRIFEEYGQAPSGAAAWIGTGLGLPLARRFAEQHGGTLEVQSGPGRGSVFTVRMPLAGPAPHRVLALQTGGIADLDDIEPTPWRPFDHPDVRAHLTDLLPVLGIGAVVLGGITLVADQIDPTPGYQPVPLLVLAGIAMAIAAWIATTRRLRSTTQVSALLVVATVGFTLADYYVTSAQQAYGSMLYVWVGIAAVAFLSRRAVVAHLAFVGACYAVLLAAQTGNAAPVARWVVVVGMLTVSALSIDTLLARLASLADAERRARIRLESIHGELEAASRHKTQFLATMSHELRTPLNAIIGFSEVLQDELFGPLTDKQREYACDLAEAGHQLLALVNDILDLAKVDAGRMDLDLTEHVDIADLLVVICRRDIGLPVHLVLGDFRPLDVDEHKFRRIVANLIDEAAGIAGVAGVQVAAAVSAAGLTLEVTAMAVMRPDPGVMPLRVAVAAAFTLLHGGRIEPTVSGWLLTLPLPALSRERV